MQDRNNRDAGYSQRGAQRFDRDEAGAAREPDRNDRTRAPNRYRSEGQSFRNQQSVRNDGQWAGRGSEREYEPDYSNYEPTAANYERGYASDQVYGRGERDRFLGSRERERSFGEWERTPWQDERERERWAESRDRGYGSGVSGQYFTRGRFGNTRDDSDSDDARFAGQYGQRDINQGRFEAGRGTRGVQAAGSGYGTAGYGNSDRVSHGSSDGWREARQSRQNRPENRDFGVGGLQQGGFASPDTFTSHYGRGPKGYTRSDDRIREDLSERLHDDHDVDATEISIIVKEGEVTLIGAVENRREKHRAEDIADSVSGVKDVHNQLRVNKGVMSQIAEKVQHGVDRLTGASNETRNENRPGTAGTGSATANNRNAS